METFLLVMPTCAGAQVAYSPKPACIFVGQIATKLIGFSKGITVTAGLPMVFTAPLRGTAFDIAGQRKADPEALQHALRAGARFATRNYRPASAT